MKTCLQLKSGFIHIPPCIHINSRTLNKDNWVCFDSMIELKDFAQKNDVKTTLCSFCALTTKAYRAWSRKT